MPPETGLRFYLRPLTGRTKMTPSELTALEALGVGIQAKFDAFEVYAELARRVPASFLQEKIKLLAKEKRIWRY